MRHEVYNNWDILTSIECYSFFYCYLQIIRMSIFHTWRQTEGLRDKTEEINVQLPRTGTNKKQKEEKN